METGFYYLQSRYYDPTMYRFINADSLASTGQGVTGTNMFAYCLNNPVLCVDFSGTRSILWQMCVLQDHHSGEFDINYPSYASMQLFHEAQEIMRSSTYSEAIWNTLDSNGRKSTIISFAQEIAGVLGITRHDFYLLDEDEYIEGYHVDKIIVINTDYINDYRILVTVAHELYHAYQEDVVNGAISHGEPRAVVAAWRQSFANYHAPGDIVNGYVWSYSDYYNQAVEIGANWFSGSLDGSQYEGTWYGYYGK